MSSLGDVTRPHAEARGRAMVKLLGKGWTYEVWDNFGWHAQAVKGGIKVFENRYGGRLSSYGAQINAIDEPGGRWSGSGPTPQLAIRVALIEAEKDLAQIERIVRAALWEAMIQ